MIIFKVTVMLGCILLGYLVGYAVGVRKGKRMERSRLREQLKRRREERKKRKAEANAEQNSSMQPPLEKTAVVLSPPAKHAPYQAVSNPSVPRPPVPSEHSVNALTPEQISSVYSSFLIKSSVKLEFNYTFPDSILFTEGKGYLVSSTGELLPDREIYSSANLITGYAMNGLLRVFDASVNGIVYDFNQIMDGKLGRGYARISGIGAMAEVQPSMGCGSFTLKKKGCLHVELLE